MKCPTCGTVNPQSNRFCRVCGTVLGGRPAGESSRRVGTVLFADMTGFTAMSERLDPEEVYEITNDFLQALAACVHRYGGTIDKYIGDEIMAIFGAPRAHEDDPERALATALEMREGMHAVNQRLAHRLPQPRGLHSGINTGLLIFGRVGDVARSDFTVMGDTVNLASRLCDEAVDGQIIVSDNTYRLTRHAFAFRTLDPVRVKGKAEPIPVYEVLGRRARRESKRGVPGVRARLVGRDAELAQITEAVRRLEEGTGGFVSVTGPAGVGKSRLLSEARLASATRPITWVEAACVSLGLGGTLAVWADVVRRLLGVTGPADRKSVTTRISTTTNMTSMMSLDELRDASASLAQLLHLEAGAEEPQASMSGADDEAARRRLFLAVRDLIAAEAGRQPLVLVIDDLHWADSASLRLLGHVLESNARVPLLVIAAFRSEAEIRGDLDELVTHANPPSRVDIELQSLSPEDSSALAEALLGADPALAEVRDWLVSYGEGNPLFTEEVLRSLIDQGVVRHESGQWRRPSQDQEPRAVVLPETLQGLLQDRIDRLPESSKRLVQIAAVIGRTFPSALLGQIGGFGADPAPLLANLEQSGFFERAPAGPGGADFRFRQSLMQEAAYASLLLRHRRDYHRRVAEWYERQPAGPQPISELAAILTLHWERAEEWGRAAQWALRAADDARRAAALDDARDLYNRALQLGERAADGDVRRAAFQGLGEIDFATSESTARDHFHAALELAREPLERAALERWIGQVLDHEGAYNLALAAFTRANTILGDERPGENLEWTVERARLRVARAAAHLRRGDDELAQLVAEAALGVGLPPADRADASILLGNVLLRRGDAEQAASHFNEALKLARSSSDLRRTGIALERLAATALQRRDHAAARGHVNECLGVLRRLGDNTQYATVLTRLAVLDEQDGVLLQAADRLREAVERATATDEPVVAAGAQLMLGRVLRVLGDWWGARAALERAGRDDPEIAGRAALELELLRLERGEEPEAELRQALAEGERLGIPDLAAYARLGLATIAGRRGHRDEARTYLRDLLASANGGEDETTTMARLGFVELTLDEGRADVAVAGARRSLEAAQSTGPAHLVWRVRRTLGRALGEAGEYAEAEKELRLATDEARAAEAYPELASCLAAWAGVRMRAHGRDDQEARAMLVERREILGFLSHDVTPPPDGAAGTPTAPSPAPAT